LKHDYGKFIFGSDRDELIVRLCSGKHVLHIGACDTPYTLRKYHAGLLLHQKIARVARRLQGVDIDSDAIMLMKDLGFDDIQLSDISEYSVGNEYPEIIIFGETIEHLENPGKFLLGLKDKMDSASELLISTPNVYSLGFQLMVLRGRERVHSDHLLGYSPGLLIQTMQRFGFEIVDCHMTFLPRSDEGWKKRFWRAFARYRVGWSETILLRVKKSAV
jgi:2-polyprenyl-3-methyl-5-hydroxy-6-metoxy-1,4-benzoquinol methylase